MAHKKAAGSTRLGRDSKAKRLGVKVFGGQMAKAGAIIVKQRGTKFMAGNGVGVGKDDSLFAVIGGLVKFKKVKRTLFTGSRRTSQIVSVEPRSQEKPAKAKKTVAKAKAKA